MSVRTLLSGLLFMSAVHLAGQSPFIEVLDQAHPAVYYTGVLPVDSALVVITWYDPGNGGGSFGKFLLSYSPSGQVLDSMWYYIPSFLWRKTTRAADGGAWLAGPLDGCDLFFTGHIQRFDRYGNLVFERTYEQAELLPLTFLTLEGIAKDPAERLALFFGTFSMDNSGVLITDTLGNILEQWLLPNSQVGGPASWYMDSLLITSGSSHVYMRGASGTILHSRNLGTPIHDLTVEDDRIWALGFNTLYQLDEELEMVDSIPLPVVYAARQFVHGGNAPHFRLGEALYQYGSGQGITPVFTASLVNGQEIHSLVLKDTLVHAIGVQKIELDPYDDLWTFSGGLLKSYGLSGATSTHNEDVAVETVSMDSLWLTISGSGSYGYQYGDLSVTVRNMGTEPLQEFMLVHRSGLRSITCGTHTNFVTVTNANIAPGDVATIAMPNALLWTGQISPGDVIEHTVCVTALGPNGLMDRNIEDNTTCIPLLITMNISVGIDEERSISRVHPSPFTDHFVIDISPQGNSHARLHDAKGVVVLEQPLLGPGRHVIPADGLLSGIYFLTIATDNGISHFKLVRE